MSFIIEDVGLALEGPELRRRAGRASRTAHVFSIGGVDYEWNKLIVVLITVPVLLALL